MHLFQTKCIIKNEISKPLDKKLLAKDFLVDEDIFGSFVDSANECFILCTRRSAVEFHLDWK